MSAIYAFDGSVICCDDARHATLDSNGEELHPDDALIAKAVANAVCDALRARRKGGDTRLDDAETARHGSREVDDRNDGLTEKERVRIFDQASDKHTQALARAMDVLNRRGAHDSADGVFLDLDAMFAAPAHTDYSGA